MVSFIDLRVYTVACHAACHRCRSDRCPLTYDFECDDNVDAMTIRLLDSFLPRRRQRYSHDISWRKQARYLEHVLADHNRSISATKVIFSLAGHVCDGECRVRWMVWVWCLEREDGCCRSLRGMMKMKMQSFRGCTCSCSRQLYLKVEGVIHGRGFLESFAPALPCGEAQSQSSDEEGAGRGMWLFRCFPGCKRTFTRKERR